MIDLILAILHGTFLLPFWELTNGSPSGLGLVYVLLLLIVLGPLALRVWR